MKKTIGLIGCGSIGRALAGFAYKKLSSKINKILLWDSDPDALSFLSEKVPSAEKAESFEDILGKSDLLIEAAQASVVPGFLEAVISSGKDGMVMSIGGVLGNEALLLSAEEKGVRIMFPTGAIAGIDAVKAAKIGGIERVTLTTRKSPASLVGAPYFEEQGIDLNGISCETVVFQGTASEAMKHFPKNINVSALLSLAGIGPDQTRVIIAASPEFKTNSHEIEIIGKAGKLKLLSENMPSPDNPRTSYMASLSAMACLNDYFSAVRMGT